MKDCTYLVDGSALNGCLEARDSLIAASEGLPIRCTFIYRHISSLNKFIGFTETNRVMTSPEVVEERREYAHFVSVMVQKASKNKPNSTKLFEEYENAFDRAVNVLDTLPLVRREDFYDGAHVVYEKTFHETPKFYQEPTNTLRGRILCGRKLLSAFFALGSSNNTMLITSCPRTARCARDLVKPIIEYTGAKDAGLFSKQLFVFERRKPSREFLIERFSRQIYPIL